jgi:UDP-N-acetylglucosamine pyrophosphorylase
MSGFLITPGMTPAQIEALKQVVFVENSMQHHANLRAAEERALAKEKLDAENKATLEKILRENEIEAAKEAKRLQAEARGNLLAQLRERYFAASPAATEADWNAVKADAVKQHFLNAMMAEQTSEERMRQAGGYARM